MANFEVELQGDFDNVLRKYHNRTVGITAETFDFENVPSSGVTYLVFKNGKNRVAAFPYFVSVKQI